MAEPPESPPTSRLSAGLDALRRSTLGPALLGSLLVWLAQPPLSLAWLAWIAPAPWLLLVQRESLRGRRSWAAVWAAGVAYWAAAVYWVSLPHPLTPIGLGFLAAYLGCYLPVFVAITRVGVHRNRLPLWIVAPVVWTALEAVQARLFSGFLMGALGHTQAFSPDVIQIAEWTGAYGVSFVLMMFAAGIVDGLTRWLARRQPATLPIDQRPPLGFLAAGLPLAVTVFVGHHATRAADQRYANQSNPEPTVALIQGDTQATWDPAPDRARRIMDSHLALSRTAVDRATRAGRTIDLLVWPESMFRTPLITFEGSVAPPPELGEAGAARARVAGSDLASLAGWVGAPMLLGIDQFDFRPPFEGDPNAWPYNAHNSAALVDARGDVQAVYAKMHRVPFGEYIPLFKDLPAMGFLTKLPAGIQPGATPVAMTIERPTPPGQPPLIVCPSICYETVIPHVIRGQVRELQDAGAPPDLLVNVTNNAWFWGSSELEMHLACNLFRAVENRTPMVVAANGGLSAVIDSAGRVLRVSRRQTEQVILADVPLDPRTSFYTRHGDVFAWSCLIATGALAIIGVANRRHRKRGAE